MANHTSYKIALYNHKGGVGKTTLTANISASLATKGKRVLVVDSDPQCNLTSYFFEDTVVDSLLDESDSPNGATIWSAMKPVVDARGDYKFVEPIETVTKNLWLLPGDIRLAEFESSLNDFWDNCFQRKVKGFRGTNSLSALVKECSRKIKADFIFYDTGPNIGPLNRVILLDCNYFIVPAACDLFSIRALKSLGHVLAGWVTDWKTILSLAPSKTYLMEGKPNYLGYIPQRFKVYGGVPTSISTHYISRIEKAIYSDVVLILRDVDQSLASSSMKGTRLGEIKDFASLVQLGQVEGLPMFEVSGGVEGQKEQARVAFDSIAEAIIKKIEES